MSINPAIVGIELPSPSGDPAEYESVSKASRHQQVGPESNSGTDPKQKQEHPTIEKDSAELTQDAVQVQREEGNQIVIKYLDHDGQVIFQVPSAQLLRLQEAIAQTLEEQQQKQERAHLEVTKSIGGAANGH